MRKFVDIEIEGPVEKRVPLMLRKDGSVYSPVEKRVPLRLRKDGSVYSPVECESHSAFRRSLGDRLFSPQDDPAYWSKAFSAAKTLDDIQMEIGLFTAYNNINRIFYHGTFPHAVKVGGLLHFAIQAQTPLAIVKYLVEKKQADINLLGN